MLSDCHTSPISQLMILFLTLFLKEMAFSLYNPRGCFLWWLGVVCLQYFYSKHQVEFSQPMIIFSHTNLFTFITRLGIPLISTESPRQRLISYCWLLSTKLSPSLNKDLVNLSLPREDFLALIYSTTVTPYSNNHYTLKQNLLLVT